jgi:hypothetical protein
MTAAATIASPCLPITVPPPGGGGRAAQAYRSVIGEPDRACRLKRAAVDRTWPRRTGRANRLGRTGRCRPRARGRDPAGRGARRSAGGGAATPVRRPARRRSRPVPGRPSGVVYAISSDGVLHVMGCNRGGHPATGGVLPG